MKAKTYRYSVAPDERRVRFPVDMLRYDRAFPAREVDSSLIHNSLRLPNPPTEGAQVMLVADKPPTLDRWTSFGWKVGEVTSS